MVQSRQQEDKLPSLSRTMSILAHREPDRLEAYQPSQARCLTSKARHCPLDFLRVLRIKTLREFMERFFLKLLYGVLSIGLVSFVTGCGEDPRYSAKTQYLGGGVYGGAAHGAPGEPHCYWVGGNPPRSPSLRISLREERGEFF